MKNTLIFLLLGMTSVGNAQIRYAGKLETSYMKYLTRLIRVDPGPNWKGYDLNNNQNGVALQIINGISFNKKRDFIGLGVGYINFEGISGVSVFSDIECVSSKKKIAPLVNMKLGYSHIWNQYDGGKGSVLWEANVGLNYKLTEKRAIYCKSGLMLVHQASFMPFTVGFRF